MRSKQPKSREVREEIGAKGRVIINIYLSILPFLPSLPLLCILARIGGIFLCGTYAQHNLPFSLPICFFKGRKGRVAFRRPIDSGFPLPVGLDFKGRVREEWREGI